MTLTFEDVQPLITRYHQRLQAVSLNFVRYLYARINWEARLIGVKGARGVGKTTLLFQRIKMAHPNPDTALYVTLDDLWFSTHTLDDMIGYFYPRGVHTFYLDEVHKYPDWSRVIKNIHDFYSDIKIIYTGSALLAIDHSVADLSRRQSVYTLWGMSFREYLEYEYGMKMAVLSLPELLSSHVAVSMELSSKIPVLKIFEDYLRHGYYPFYKENPPEFGFHLAEVIRQVIEGDIPDTEEISLNTVYKLKTLMMIMAENTPLEPNVTRLAERLECSRELCLKMLYLLEKATLIQLMFHHPRNYKQMRGPEKVLGGDTNIFFALTAGVNIGTVRETFFVNQLKVIGEVLLADHGDFTVGGNTFEVGGSGKRFTQIADMPNSYLAVDGVMTGYGARIPLYLFGLLY